VKKNYLWLLCTAFLWSLAGVAIRSSSTTGITFSIYSAAAAIPVSLLLRHRSILINKTTLLVGVAHYVMSMTFIYANNLTTVANALILQYTSTVFVLIYQSIDEHHLPTLWQTVQIIWVFIGMIIFFADGLQGGHLLGNMLALCSGAAFGVEFYVNTKAEADAFSSCIIGYSLAVICGFLIIRKVPELSPSSWLSVLTYGAVVIGMAGVCYSIGISDADPLTANLICMLEILISPLWAFILFKEVISPLALVGAVIIVSAIVTSAVVEVKTKS